MTYGELKRELACKFNHNKPARVRMSVQLAKQIAASPDGSMLVEITEVRVDPENSDLMTLVLTDVRALTKIPT